MRVPPSMHSLNLLSPEQDAQILREAGFQGRRAVLRRLYLARLGWLRVKRAP